MTVRPISRRGALTSLSSASLVATDALAASPSPTAKGSAMKAGRMRVYEIGDNKNGFTLHIVERPIPTPRPGQVVMRVRATGINARDLDIMRGGMFGQTQPHTRVPLSDNAGEIAAVGPGVTRVKVGDRVTMTHYWRWLDGAWDESMRNEDYANNIDGFLAEYVLVPADPIIKIPDSMTFEEASTLQSAGLTSWNAVVANGRIKPGETMLTIGTGGVSVFGFQWAKMAGARVIITSSSDAKLDVMRKMGADVTINYRANPNWTQEVLDRTGGRGVDMVLNNVGLAELDNCITCCASGARIMHIGANAVARNQPAPAPPPAPKQMGKVIIRDLTIKGIIVGSRRMFEDLIVAMQQHNVKPMIDRVYPFEQAREAIAYMESGDKLGKVVIKIG